MNHPNDAPGVASIHPLKWCEYLASEYLSSFIKDGGAVVKFAVALDQVGRDQAWQMIGERAEALGYFVARVSADETKVHMMDQVWFQVAQMFPWVAAGEKVVIRLASEIGYRPPDSGDGSLLERLARSNGIDPQMLLSDLDLKNKIEHKVFKNKSLARDFRVAMTKICLSCLRGGSDGDMAISCLMDWLTGKNKAISAVKPYMIFSRIQRTNARHFFESLLHWAKEACYTGIVLLMDIKRLSVAKNPRDGSVYYSKAAVLDAYEVLRQFIDSTDRIAGGLIVVIPDTSFLDDDIRGIGAYDALKYRVYDEIRDRRMVNPLAALVRLSNTVPPALEVAES